MDTKDPVAFKEHSAPVVLSKKRLSINNDPGMVSNPLFAGNALVVQTAAHHTTPMQSTAATPVLKHLGLAFLLFVSIPIGIVSWASFGHPQAFSVYLKKHFMSFFIILLSWCGVIHYGMVSLTLPRERKMDTLKESRLRQTDSISLKAFSTCMCGLVLLSWLHGFEAEKTVTSQSVQQPKPVYDFGSCDFGWGDALNPNICGSPASLAQITPLESGGESPARELFVDLIGVVGQFVEADMETFLPFLFQDETEKGGETCARFINSHIVCNVLVQQCSDTCEIDRDIDHAICKALNTDGFDSACTPSNRHALASRTRVTLKDLLPMVTSVLSNSVSASLEKKKMLTKTNKELIIAYVNLALQMYETIDESLTRPGGIDCQNITAAKVNQTMKNVNHNCSTAEYRRVMRELDLYKHGKTVTRKVRTFFFVNAIVTIFVVLVVCLHLAFICPRVFSLKCVSNTRIDRPSTQAKHEYQQEKLTNVERKQLVACLITEIALMVGMIFKISSFEERGVLDLTQHNFSMYVALFNILSLLIVLMIFYHCQHSLRVIFYGHKLLEDEEEVIQDSPANGGNKETIPSWKQNPIQFIAGLYKKYGELTDMDTGPYFFADTFISEAIEVVTQIITFDTLSKQNDVVYVQLATLLISANLILTPLCLWHRHQHPRASRRMLPVLQNTLDLLYLILNFVYLLPANVSSMPILYAVLSPSYWLFDALKDFFEGISVAQPYSSNTHDEEMNLAADLQRRVSDYMGETKSLRVVAATKSLRKIIAPTRLQKISAAAKWVEIALVIGMVTSGLALTSWITVQTISINVYCSAIISPAIWEGSHPRYVFSNGPFAPATCALSLIQSIQASNRGVKSLTSSIGLLSNLTTLNLENNDIRALPASITKLTSLTPGLPGLNLKGNPVWTSLSWDGAQLSHFPEIIHKHLTELVTLRLPRNNISSLPPGIASLQSLQSLDLETNSIRSLPGELATLSKLVKLNCIDNPVVSHFSWSENSSPLDVAKKIRVLKMLPATLLSLNWSNGSPDRANKDCRHCKSRATGKFLCSHHLKDLFVFAHLQRVNVSGQCLATFSPSTFNTSMHWPSLTTLDISDNPIYDFDPRLMVDITRDIISGRHGTVLCHGMRSKSASFTGVDQFFPWPIILSMKRELEYFSADKSFGLHETPSFSALCALSNLKSLFLTETQKEHGTVNRKYTEVPACWFNSFGNLEIFFVKISGLKGRLPPIFQLPKINVFDLQDTPFAPALTLSLDKVFLPRSLTHWSVQEICINHIFNASTIHVFSHVTSIGLLEAAYDNRCVLEEFPRVDLKVIDHVEKLKISENFIGNIPYSFHVLKKLKLFEWTFVQSPSKQKENISIEIPAFLGNMTKLERLILDAADLPVRTKIGPWLSQLVNLHELKVSEAVFDKSLWPLVVQLSSLDTLSMSLSVNESDISWMAKLKQIQTLDLLGSAMVEDYNTTTSELNISFVLESLPRLKIFYFKIDFPNSGYSASEILQMRKAFPDKLLCLKWRDCADGLAFRRAYGS